MEKRIEIISLGVNCMPRTVLTKNGIKPSKKEGELSCPFDLVEHKLDRIIYYIKNDFKSYFDDISFTLLKKGFFDLRGKGIWEKSDGTKFFHDKDCKANDKEKLISRIRNRINNFQEIMENEKPILFVLSIKNENNLIDELYSVLKEKRQNKKFKLAIIDFNNKTEFNHKYNDDIYILRIPLPTSNYYRDWNKTKFRKSQIGKYSETCICEFVKDIIKKDFE